MKSLLNLTFLIIFINLSAQNYYPKLNNLWFEEDEVINLNEYSHLVTEVRRISEKIFYKNYQFSGTLNQSSFTSLQIIPKKDSIQNIFKSPITIIFDKEANQKTEGIPMTYTQNVNTENKTLKSNLVIDKGGFNLWIPEKLFRNSASKKIRLLFNITNADIDVANGSTIIKLDGTFPEEIKFKRSPTQEIKSIFLTYTKNKITMSIPYTDKKEKQQNKILFEEDFE